MAGLEPIFISFSISILGLKLAQFFFSNFQSYLGKNCIKSNMDTIFDNLPYSSDQWNPNLY